MYSSCQCLRIVGSFYQPPPPPPPPPPPEEPPPDDPPPLLLGDEDELELIEFIDEANELVLKCVKLLVP